MSEQVWSSVLPAGLNVIMLREGPEDDECEHGGVDDVVDVSTTLAFELEGRGGNSEDAEGRDELFKEAAEGLPEGKKTGDKRKLRMGRYSSELDGEGSCSPEVYNRHVICERVNQPTPARSARATFSAVASTDNRLPCSKAIILSSRKQCGQYGNRAWVRSRHQFDQGGRS